MRASASSCLRWTTRISFPKMFTPRPSVESTNPSRLRSFSRTRSCCMRRRTCSSASSTRFRRDQHTNATNATRTNRPSNATVTASADHSHVLMEERGPIFRHTTHAQISSGLPPPGFEPRPHCTAASSHATCPSVALTVWTMGSIPLPTRSNVEIEAHPSALRLTNANRPDARSKLPPCVASWNTSSPVEPCRPFSRPSIAASSWWSSLMSPTACRIDPMIVDSSSTASLAKNRRSSTAMSCHAPTSSLASSVRRCPARSRGFGGPEVRSRLELVFGDLFTACTPLPQPPSPLPSICATRSLSATATVRSPSIPCGAFQARLAGSDPTTTNLRSPPHPSSSVP
mmetsp:Transcript_38665/g.77547  ORF Transcript_38665/g.77547 Transcript_38665/m.77547 type:complete len:343 (+) Transcript_38665:1858-2886(+)